MKLETSMETVCPQCNSSLNLPTARLVQDSCGHKKCRLCLLQDESECKICLQENYVEKEETLGVIKYEDNHTAVITRNRLNTTPESSKHKIKLGESRKTADTITEKKVEKRLRTNLNLPNYIVVTNQNPVLYKCKVCGKSFRTKSHIRYHSYCNGEQKPLRCAKCDKLFISKYHLEMHLLGHSGKKQYNCDVCSKSFRQRGILNRHKLIHSELKQFTCEACNKCFKSKNYLYRHSLIHNQEKTFSCKQCDAKFNNSSNLNQHQVTHTKDKIHMCDECGKRFKLKGALTVHRRSHSRLRPHVCSTCSKAFINAKELHRHKLTHTDAGCFICNLCGLSCRRKDNLQRHIRNTHPGNVVVEKSKASDENDEKETEIDEYIENAPTENPNAIKVITASPINKTNPISNNNGSDNDGLVTASSKQVPVINGPLKLAFKTHAFKSYYNIHSRDYAEAPRIQTKPYDYAESVNICKKILSPSSPPRQRTIIKTLGKVSERDSNQICQRILLPEVPFITASSKYINLSKKNIFNDIRDDGVETDYSVKEKNDWSNGEEDDVVKSSPPSNAASVIVKSYSISQHELHWRRRTLQNLELRSKCNT